MRVEDITFVLKKRRFELQEAMFAKPPQNFEDFKQRLGIWIGIGEALKAIEDARKAEDEDYT